MNDRFTYRAFGLDVESDLELPELPRKDLHGVAADLRIETAPYPLVAPSEAVDCCFTSVPGCGYAMRVDGVADFLVAAGARIRMARMPAGDAAMARLYLLGSALGMALHQRGWLVLHAAAVLLDDGVRLFIGESGAGKSTLAAAYGIAGHGVLADDLMPIRLEDHRLVVWPGASSFKLWSDSLETLGVDKTGLAPIANRLEKYLLINGKPLADAAYPVAEIVVLEEVAGEPLGLQTLGGLEAIRAIASNTYRPEYVKVLGRHAEHFRQCVEVTTRVPVRRMRRPWNPAQIAAESLRSEAKQRAT